MNIYIYVCVCMYTYMYAYGGLIGLALRVHFCHGRARVQERVFPQACRRAL